MDVEADDLSKILDSGPAALSPADLLTRDDLPAGARQLLGHLVELERGPAFRHKAMETDRSRAKYRHS